MSSLVFSIPSAPATSGAAPASAASANANARGRDAKPAEGSDGFGAALARMRDARSRQSGDKADGADTAGTATPLGRRRALATDDQGKEGSTPADLLAMAMLTPAFSAQAAQQRQAAATGAAGEGTQAPLQAAIDGEATASTASALAGTATEMAAADAQPAATADKPSKTARAADSDAPDDTATASGAAKPDAAAPLPDLKTAAAAASVAVPTPAPVPTAPVASGTSGKDGKPAGASPAIAALDAKSASGAATAAAQASEPSVADQVESSGSSTDTPGSLPAQLAFKTALAEASGNGSNAPAAQALPRFNVPSQVGSESWGADIGRQMIRMGADGHHVAELNLNPAGLGPLKVTLTMGDGQAQAMFASAHESVRRAVEAALPQLRDTLASQGIQLGQASVDAGAQQQQQQAFGQQERAFDGGLRGTGREPQRAAAEVQAAAPARSAATRSTSGIDTFA